MDLMWVLVGIFFFLQFVVFHGAFVVVIVVVSGGDVAGAVCWVLGVYSGWE